MQPLTFTHYPQVVGVTTAQGLPQATVTAVEDGGFVSRALNEVEPLRTRARTVLGSVGDVWSARVCMGVYVCVCVWVCGCMGVCV